VFVRCNGGLGSNAAFRALAAGARHDRLRRKRPAPKCLGPQSVPPGAASRLKKNLQFRSALFTHS
jgi:hypothetical protein